MAKLTEGISIQQLLDNGGVEFEVQLRDSEDPQEDTSDNEGVEEALLQFQNLNCLADDDDYVEGEPFEIIANKMTNLIEDGGVKKRVLREGYGETPPDLAVVKVDYNAYIEYEPVPFDSTYSRKRKHEFIINNCEVIAGLDIAVQSMKINEKSQFLIKPEYAYGAMGCLGRVPKNSTVLFEIELHETVDSGAALSFHKLNEEKKADFEEVFKYCLSLCARGSDKFKRNAFEAVKEYNTAVDRMESVVLKDYTQQEKQQDLLFRLYTNIVVCYTKLEKPKKACIAANKIHLIAKGTQIKIKPKVYFCHAKCLRMLGDFDQARKKLEIARQLSPNNPDIANEFMLLQQDIQDKKKRENMMAKALQ